MDSPQRANLRFWQALSAERREVILGMLRSTIRENAEKYVATFYGAFLQHAEGSTFLTHSVVQEKLSHSLRNWLLDLLDMDFSDVRGYEQRQRHIGDIHARIKIPVHLVLEGASLLKIEVARTMMQTGVEELDILDCLVLLDEIIDYAMRIMSSAYVEGTNERAHVDEAFRLFSLGQDITTERESQRAALMEWCQEILFGMVTNRPGRLETLSNSHFGLWIRHRAKILFRGATMLDSMEQIIGHIDGDILPRLSRSSGPEETARLMGELQAKIDEIKFLLSDLFQAAGDLESGRDPLTRALNRKFLASVLSREISLASSLEHPLSVIMVDIDRFKDINDEHGHSGGDMVLRQAADLILDTVRISDFVFRYGGEEFLIVLVETSGEEAARLAERLRLKFVDRAFALPDQKSIRITLSAGVAAYDGHPDYEFLVEAADEALYAAKRAGRNRVVAS